MWVRGWMWPKAIPVLLKCEAELARKQGWLEGGWTPSLARPVRPQGSVANGEAVLCPWAVAMLQFSGATLHPHPRSLPPLGASALWLDTALMGWEGEIL